MVNLALNKVQPAAILHIPVHFGNYAREEAAKPFLKFMGERISTAQHQWQEGQLQLIETTPPAQTQMQSR